MLTLFVILQTTCTLSTTRSELADGVAAKRTLLFLRNGDDRPVLTNHSFALPCLPLSSNHHVRCFTSDLCETDTS